MEDRPQRMLGILYGCAGLLILVRADAPYVNASSLTGVLASGELLLALVVLVVSFALGLRRP